MNKQRITTITPNDPIHFWYAPFTADAVTYTINKTPTEKELETICRQIEHLVRYEKNDNLHFVILFPDYKTTLFFMPKRGLFHEFTNNALPESYNHAMKQITKTAQDVIDSYKNHN